MILQRILKWLIVAHLLINFCDCFHLGQPNSQDRDVRQLHRDKRFLLPPGVGQYKLNNTFQSCVTHDGKEGHCKHFASCFMSELDDDMSRLPEFMCQIEEEFVGVCCPDNSLISSNSLTIEDTVAGVLPAISLSNVTDNGNGDALRASDALANKTRSAQGLRGCGVNAKIRSRVLGGTVAEPKEWPWMAAILHAQDRKHFCGGVIITNRHILTAAHCIFRERARDVIVRLGEYDFGTTADTRHVDFQVQEIRPHLDFNPSTYDHDIAILKLKKNTVFNSYIWPICLPPVDVTFENEQAIVTGWGAVIHEGPSSNILRQVMVPVWTQEQCRQNVTQDISDKVLCASGFNGGKDACQGDSGGPLVHQLSNGRWVNIGIVSWGIHCGEPGRPGVYVRVNSYLNWIVANTLF